MATSRVPRKKVKNYEIKKHKNKIRNFSSNSEILEKITPWTSFARFYKSEIIPILKEQIKVDDMRQAKNPIPDILFEYMVVRSVTILEINLKHHCSVLIEKFPSRAESLLPNRDKTQNLTIQILSSFSFSNLSDIKHVFSTLLGKDYFQILKHRSEEQQISIGYEDSRIDRASPLYKKWGMFEQIIELRNKLIHENERINIKSKKVRKNLLNTIYDVLYLTHEELREPPYHDDTFTKINPEY